MAMRLERISVASATKHLALFGALAGLICGILYAGGGLIIDIIEGNLGVGTILAFGALLGMPLIGAAYGAVLGPIAAWLYNVSARVCGGLEVVLGRSPLSRPAERDEGGESVS